MTTDVIQEKPFVSLWGNLKLLPLSHWWEVMQKPIRPIPPGCVSGCRFAEQENAELQHPTSGPTLMGLMQAQSLPWKPEKLQLQSHASPLPGVMPGQDTDPEPDPLAEPQEPPRVQPDQLGPGQERVSASAKDDGVQLSGEGCEALA